MGLSSLQLDAFFAAARARNFSQAALDLHITQSALSQRIKALEEELDLTLFIRLRRGVQLTEAGERVLRYCQARSSLEGELLDQLTSKGQGKHGLGGVLRIGGYSSVVRSVVIPALGPLLRDNPAVQAHFQNAEMRELPELLLTGYVDFIVTDEPMHRAGIETVQLGQEEYVMCEGAKYPGTAERYLDHDPDDTTTNRYLASQARPVPDYERSFMDEIYAIIDGVAHGLGKAVLSRHLIARDARIRVLPRYRSMPVSVLLHHHKQPFYTALHRAAVDALVKRCPGLLRDG
jgi:DNA-binding transcriptional LysR family regulator